MDENQILIEEWKDIRETLRYFGNKRFAQLTVFIAATGFMVDAFLRQITLPTRIGLPIIGMLLGLAFLVMEISSVRYTESFAKRGREIEIKIPSLELMTSARPHPTGLQKLITGTIATYALYTGAFLFWGTSFLWR